jgi:DNA polymerase (family 10)
VAIDTCPLLEPALEALALALIAGHRAEPVPGLADLDLAVGADGAGSAAFHLALPAGKKAVRRAEALLAATPALRGALLLSPGQPARTFGDPVLRRPAPQAPGVALLSRADLFAQGNAAANERLVAAAIEVLAPGPADEAIELYSGAGNFTFALARRVAKVTAVEEAGPSLELARRAASAAGEAAGHVRFMAGDAVKVARGLAAEGRLADVSGVGKKLAVSIAEIVETGTFAELEALKASFTPSLVRVMDVPGVGPKRARLLHDELGVESLDDLERVLADGSLAGLPGLGEKTASSIAAGLEHAKRHGERILLMDALPQAEAIAETLRRLPGVIAAEPAGSIRRRQETVGDIDVLVASSDPEAVMDAARTLPQAMRVLASGPTKTSVLTASGRQADIRVVEPGAWGAALQYFTGDKAHNVRLRELAKRGGLKVNEYGVFRTEGDERLGGATEGEVYGLLGMDVPPPELRQDCGEIEAALAHRLPRLLELQDIRGDFHVHSTSTDSSSTLEENREMAAELGYEYVAVTDHAYDLRMVRGLDVAQLEAQWAHVDALNAEGGPYVLKGIELNIGDEGGVDYPAEVLARFDFCIASLHGGFRQPRDVATRRLLNAIHNPYVDIIGHPTGRILGRRDPIDLDMEAVLRTAGETGTIMEINAYPDRLDLSDAHLRLARRFGVRFALGTDAHRAEQMRFMPYGVAQARRGWVTADELLNAQPLDTVRAWLKRNAR